MLDYFKRGNLFGLSQASGDKMRVNLSFFFMGHLITGITHCLVIRLQANSNQIPQIFVCVVLVTVSFLNGYQSAFLTFCRQMIITINFRHTGQKTEWG